VRRHQFSTVLGPARRNRTGVAATSHGVHSCSVPSPPPRSSKQHHDTSPVHWMPPGPVQLGLVAAGVGTTMAHHSVSFHGAAMASMSSRRHSVGFHNTTTGRQWHSGGIDKRQPDDGELGSRRHGTRSRLKSFFRKLIFHVG
jgi:hypothetical protein